MEQDPIQYFTDREFGPRPRTIDVIDMRLWGGISALIETRTEDGSFGYKFPLQCPDGRGPYGCDSTNFGRMLIAEVREIDWPLPSISLPTTPAILDLLVFCAAAVGEPTNQDYHGFFGHHHLKWDREAGLKRFVNDVNRLLSRNGVAYELTDEGQVRRLFPQPLNDMLSMTEVDTGDDETDRLLEVARRLIVLPKFEDRKDALEKLWDAFERIKTLESGSDKRMQAENILDRTATRGTDLRQVLGEEALALTRIGNRFRIRHSEVSQEDLESSEQADYLFFRMFAFIRLILKATGRGG